MPVQPVYVTDSEVEVVLSACRVLVAVSTRSDPAVPHRVDSAGFRLLVIIAGRHVVSLGELAETVGLSVSAVNRLCDRLVQADVLDRAGEPPNGSTRLQLTDRGQELVAAGVGRRREALGLMLRRIPAPRRHELMAVLRELAAVGADAEPVDQRIHDVAHH